MKRRAINRRAKVRRREPLDVHEAWGRRIRRKVKR